MAEEILNTPPSKATGFKGTAQTYLTDTSGATGIPAVTAEKIVVDDDREFINPEGLNIGQTSAATKLADDQELSVVIPPQSETLGKITSTELGKDQITTATGAVGDVSDEALIDPDAIEGQLSEEAIIDPDTMKEELDNRATTSYQLGELMKSIEEGEPLPAWASPAIRRVSAIMQQRGMGASSMASAAMVQAIMESGIPIAQADAQAYAQIQIKGLDGKQKAALQNAVTVAQMDMTNVNNRTKAAITNAQSFLTVDLKNLDNKQAADMATYQANVQAVFTDTAAVNATNQLNAKNEAQVEQFFSELGAQVEAANKNRVLAMRQFNTNEENAMSQFNATMADATNKFNTNMKLAIEQSDVQWRRQVNTANTAVQNETNRINAQNLAGVSMAAMSFLAQDYRDQAAFNFQKTESFLQKKHEIGLLAMEFANSEKLYSKQQKDLVSGKIGEWVSSWVAGTNPTIIPPA